MKKHPRLIFHITLILTIGFYCLDYFFRISPSLILKQLMVQYHTDPLGIGLFASLFYLGYVIFQIPCGVLLDRHEVKYPIIIMVTLCTLSFLGFIAADQFWLGLVLRFILGATSACSFIAVLYIARTYLDNKWFSIISGITISAGTLAASLIQTINAWLIQYFSWQIVIGLFSVWGLVIAVLLLIMPNHMPNRLETLYQRATYLDILKQFLQLMKQPRFLLNGIIGGLFYLPTSLLTAVWGISFFENTYQFSTTQASSLIFLIFVGWAVGALIIGFIGGYFQRSKLLTVIAALLAAGVSALMLFGNAALAHWLFSEAFLFGLFSSAQVLVWKRFHQICPPNLSGIGIAATNMLIMLIVSITHSLMGYLINRSYEKMDLLNTHVYLSGLQWIPGIFVVVAVLALLNLHHRP